MRKIKFFNPGREFEIHKKEYTKAWQDVRSRGDLILRSDVEKFEKAFAKYVGTQYCIGVSNGTDAIMIAVKYLKPKRVKVPYHTFKSTVGAVIAAGSEPVFEGQADISIVAHIAGQLEPIPNGVVIEDLAQALGAVKNPITFAQTWSFYPAKVLGCSGDAGAITTNDKDFYLWAKEYRNHFKETNQDWGGNHRLDNVLVAELLIKLKRIKKTLARRKQIAKMYIKGLNVKVANIKSLNWQDFIIHIESVSSECLNSDKTCFVGKNHNCGKQQITRNKLYNFLKENGIETMKNEYFFPIKKDPWSEKYEAETLRLPCNETLTNEEVSYVIKKITEFFDAK